MDQPKTLSEALCLIYTNPGVDYLTDPDRLVAVFADIAPDRKAERAQLELLVQSGCVAKLAAARDKTAGEVKALVNQAVTVLADTYLMDRHKAEALCNTYVKALSGKAYTPATPKTDPPKPIIDTRTTTGTQKPTGGGTKKPTGGGTKTPTGGGTKTPTGGGKSGGTKTPTGGGKSGGTKTTESNGKTVTIRGSKISVTSSTPTQTPPGSGCGTGLLWAIVAFVAVYFLSALNGYETPFLNGLFTAIGVLMVSLFLSGGKKKQ